MDIVFETIGLEIPNEKDFNHLIERTGELGEATRLLRRSGILHGRCWKLGEGLEVWTVLYESETDEVFYADCRPGFRSQFPQNIAPWALTEYDEEGEAVIHGYFDKTNIEVLFQLQNLTEIRANTFFSERLRVALCGLAYTAKVSKDEKYFWKQIDKNISNLNENDWLLSGKILSFRGLRNPLSGSDLYWVYLDIGEFKLEILVNQNNLKGEKLEAGKFLTAEIWLQGHVLDRPILRSEYEGVEPFSRTIDFWKKLKRLN